MNNPRKNMKSRYMEGFKEWINENQPKFKVKND
jgi:hypothetical protein